MSAAWRTSLAACITLSCLDGGRASAQTVSATARTVYHAYQIQLVPLLDGGPIRDLNRFYQTLDLTASGLGPDHGMSTVVSLRYDTDFGTGFHRDTPAAAGIPAVDGRNDLDLLYLYFDWRGVADAPLDLRVGRQLQLDDLDWYVFDGVKLTAHLWREGINGAHVSLYAGIPVRFDALFSSPALIDDGYETYDGSGPFHGLTFGGTAQLRFFEDVSASLAYRQTLVLRDDPIETFNPRFPEASAASDGSLGLQESRLGASIGYTLRPARLDFYGHLSLDLLVGALDQARAGVAFNPEAGLHFAVEYLRVRPRFAGDSIFNFFNIFPYDRGRVEASAELYPGLTVEAGYFIQAFGGGPKGPFLTNGVTVNEGDTFPGSDLSHGPLAGVTYRKGGVGAGVSAEAATNGDTYAYGGNYRLFQAYGDLAFFEGKLVADARAGMTTVQTDWFEDVDAGLVAAPQHSYTLGVGARVRPIDLLSARVNFVKNFSSHIAGGYRIYSELALHY